MYAADFILSQKFILGSTAYCSASSSQKLPDEKDWIKFEQRAERWEKAIVPGLSRNEALNILWEFISHILPTLL